MWRQGAEAITGLVPAGWQALPAEQLAGLMPPVTPDAAGSVSLAAGFSPHPGTGTLAGPCLLVLVHEGERISEERIQKMYAWFEHNRRLVSGFLPAQVDSVAIEDIEYLPARDTIFFQARVVVDGDPFTNLTAIVFLRSGYLDLVAWVRESELAQYQEAIRGMIDSLQVPQALSYRLPATDRQRSPELAWLFEQRWRLLGAALLLLVYGLAFWPERRQARTS
ncbi:MAG: hypothetical protein AB1634_14880 [Thermodesulfobacteriota bacterium]